MQLSDEQIMHCFEICEDPDGPRCMECPYESENEIDCFKRLRHDVIGVYNRQKVEIERLKTEPYQFADIGKTHSEVKAEAIKEFAGCEMSSQHHYVKILPEYYTAIETEIKTFEIRLNDRNYKVGDILHLQEFSGGEYTGRKLTKEISYMIDDPNYCKEGYVVLGLKGDEQDV